MIYLASPYTSDDKAMQEYRYHQVMQAVAFFLQADKFVYSPIVHCHEMAKRFTLPTDALTWRKYNEAFIDSFKEIYVLCISGWSDSVGVRMEISYALEKGYPVSYWILLHNAVVRISRDIALQRDSAIVWKPSD